MFTIDSTVHFSEIAPDGYLSLPALIDYFQNCSEMQSEAAHNGAIDLGDTAWVLNSWQIEILNRPMLGDNIFVTTIPHALKGIEGHRNFLMFDADHNVLVQANSIWTFFDKISQRPIRITQDQIDAYPLDPPHPMDYAPRKINIKGIALESLTSICQVPVTRSRLDMIGHMNNCQYAAIAYDYLPEGLIYNRLRIEYKKSAMLNDIITVKQLAEEDRFLTFLCDETDSPYAILEFCDVTLSSVNA